MDIRRRGALLLPLGALAVALAVPLTVLVVGTWLTGRQLQPVRTSSMAPQYPQGSLLVVEPVDPASVRVGTPIVFEDPAHPGRLVAHRVVARLPGDQPMFRTRGDANTADDPYPVAARAVRGVVRWRVVGLGHVVDALRWPRNLLVLVVLPAALLAVTEVQAARRRREHAVAPGAGPYVPRVIVVKP